MLIVVTLLLIPITLPLISVMATKEDDIKNFLLQEFNKSNEKAASKNLNWRDDPEDTFSDWKIIVKDKSITDEIEPISQPQPPPTPTPPPPPKHQPTPQPQPQPESKPSNSTCSVQIIMNHKSPKKVIKPLSAVTPAVAPAVVPAVAPAPASVPAASAVPTSVPTPERKPQPCNTTYYVHKWALSFGGSGYFDRLFKSKLGTVEKYTSTSTFRLDTSACQAFPFMLDYLYNTGKQSKEVFDESRIDVECAVGLRSLAMYFEIPGLLHRVSEFLAKKMCRENCVSILKEAQVFSDEALSKVAAKCCAEHIGNLQEQDVLSLGASAFQMVMAARKKSDAILCSKLIYQYITDRNIQAGSACFRNLTSCEKLEELSLSTAFDFLSFIGNLTSNQGNQGIIPKLDDTLSLDKHDPLIPKIDDFHASVQQNDDTSEMYDPMCCAVCGNDACLFNLCMMSLSKNVLECTTEDLRKLQCLEKDQLQQVSEAILTGYRTKYEDLKKQTANQHN